MTIKVIDSEPDVHVTADELRRYQDEYQKAFMFYAGTPPSLESYIRDRQQRDGQHHDRLRKRVAT